MQNISFQKIDDAWLKKNLAVASDDDEREDVQFVFDQNKGLWVQTHPWVAIDKFFDLDSILV